MLHEMGIHPTFLNNFNFMFFLLASYCGLTCLLFGLGKCMAHRKTIKISKLGLQEGLLTLLYFDITNISFSMVIHYKYSHLLSLSSPSTLSIALLICLILGLVIWMPVTGRRGFGEFKKKFKHSLVCELYVPLSLAYRALLGSVMAASI